METKFKSQICTTREQSERLLALGLRKKTADMALHFSCMDMDGNAYYIPYAIGHQCNGIPAWSLHRLIEMITSSNAYGKGDWLAGIAYNAYEVLIESIEELIKYRYFPKEYLEE